MRIDRRTRLSLRLQNVLFVVLLLAAIVLAGWLTHVWRITIDWTASGRHTLGGETREVITLLDEPVRLSAYVGPDPTVRRGIRDIVERYQRAGADIRLEIINPETNPALARELGLRRGGEILLDYAGREERLQRLDEATLTNALLRLGRDDERWVVFLTGHGERDPLGSGNHDLGDFGERLVQRGVRVQTLNLARSPRVPDNVDLLVIAGPQSRYLPGELALVEQYIDAGRNLLWLAEPDTGIDLAELAAMLGIERLPGVVVDARAQPLGTDTPDFAVVTNYADHPVTEGFDATTLFPQAAALEPTGERGWRYRALARTGAGSWTETGPIDGRIAFDPDADEAAGPLTVAWAATRGTPDGHDGPAGQRIGIVGDGDFLSNAYLGNGGNQDFGIRLVHWLVGDDARVRITPDRPADIEIQLSNVALGIVGFGFLLIVPIALLAAGIIIWWRRRRF